MGGGLRGVRVDKNIFIVIGVLSSFFGIIVLGHFLSPVKIDFNANRGEVLTPVEGLKKYLNMEDTLK